jgi:hypothetical protein
VVVAVCGTFAVLLTWAFGRRLFTREVGLLSGALVAVSFWALLYSRSPSAHGARCRGCCWRFTGAGGFCRTRRRPVGRRGRMGWAWPARC